MFGQDLKPLISFVPTIEDELSADFQVTSEGSYLLNYHKNGFSWGYDKFIIYKLDAQFNMINKIVIEEGLEHKEHLKFICFRNNTWFYIAEIKTKSYVIDYTLISINTKGEIKRKKIKELTLTKPSRPHVLSNGGNFLLGSGFSRLAFNKAGFLLGMRISHTKVLMFVFNNNGELKFEKEIQYVQEGEKVKPYNLPVFDKFLIDDNDNIYFDLISMNSKGRGYVRYCSLIDGQISKNKISYNGDFNNWTSSFKCEKEFCEEFEKLDARVGDTLKYQGKNIFMSTHFIYGDHNTLERNFGVFSEVDHAVINFIKIDRASFVRPYSHFTPRIFPYEDNYYVLFNSIQKRTGVKGGGAGKNNESLFLTKLNSNLKEEYTTELIDHGKYFIVKKFKNQVITLTYKDNKYHISSLQLNQL
ncbi:MAG: hypothetical protein COB15_11920 [Flavobacteriales bacterium]|nr:MAG: hypothetical protein COB15_11920 [Flavobacteriales bacterium]